MSRLDSGILMIFELSEIHHVTLTSKAQIVELQKLF